MALTPQHFWLQYTCIGSMLCVHISLANAPGLQHVQYLVVAMKFRLCFHNFTQLTSRASCLFRTLMQGMFCHTFPGLSTSIIKYEVRFVTTLLVYPSWLKIQNHVDSSTMFGCPLGIEPGLLATHVWQPVLLLIFRKGKFLRLFPFTVGSLAGWDLILRGLFTPMQFGLSCHFQLKPCSFSL